MLNDPYLLNEDCLKNKLSLTDCDLLNEVETYIVSLKIASLRKEPIKGNLDFNYFKQIHKRLFGDVYEWAGEKRVVNIYKTVHYCFSHLINYNADLLFDDLKKKKFFTIYDEEDFLENIISFYSDLYLIHTFRDGNSRTLREYIKILLKINGYDIMFRDLKYYEVRRMNDLAAGGHEEVIYDFFKNNLTKLTKEETLKYRNLYLDEKTQKIIKGAKKDVQLFTK